MIRESEEYEIARLDHSDDTKNMLIAKAGALGFDTSKLIFVDHN